MLKHASKHVGGNWAGFPDMKVVIVANRQFVSHYEIKHTVVNYWVVLLLT